ncbi:MAG: ATP-binding protein [bacterium]|nr:ATP-binding protein [bacterium]
MGNFLRALWLGFFCVLLAAASPVQAVPVVVQSEAARTNLNPGLTFWADLQRQLSGPEAAAQSFLEPAAYHAQFSEFGSPDKNTWVRFNLNNPTGYHQDRVLYWEDWAFEAELWQRHAGQWVLQDRLDFLKGAEFPVNGTNFPYFHLTLDPGETQWMLMIRSITNIEREASLYTAEAFAQKVSRSLASYALIFGILAVMGIYNLSLYRSFGNRELLYFTGYIGFFCLFVLSRDRLFEAWFGLSLWPIWFSHVITQSIFFLGTFFFQIQYSWVMLGITKERWILRWFMYLPLLGSLVAVPVNWVDTQLAAEVINNLPVLIVLGLFGYALYFSIRRQAQAIWLLISFTPALAGGILEMISLQSGRNFMPHPWQWGVALEVTLLSGFLTRRILNLRKEKEAAQAATLEVSKAYAADLEKEVAYKTQALRQANETKDKFFSIVAHDLRGPIGSFSVLFNEVFEQGSDISQPLFDSIRTSAKNTHQLLENLLSWSRSQKDEIEYNPKDFALLPPLQANLGLYQGTAQQKGLTLRAQVDPEIGLYADLPMVTTILRNLINNALKFTPQGGSITVSASQKEDWVRVEVADTGVGMSEEIQDSLFRLDKKAHSSLGTNSESGSGLGLILCAEFVKRHGGQIGVSSQTGVGSQFWFTLPSGQADHAAAQQATLLELKRLQAMRVLLVDDNALHLESSTKVLKELGINFETAGDGQTAVDRHLASPFNLILMDIDLPDLNGVEANLAVRRAPVPAPLIVALTSYSKEELIQLAQESPFEGYLNKPLDKDKLLACLQPYLSV